MKEKQPASVVRHRLHCEEAGSVTLALQAEK